MYIVKLKNNGEDFYTLHDVRNSDTVLINPVLTLELNKSGTFTFDISPTHPHANKIKKMSSEIYVYDNNNLIYVGRPLNSVSDMYNIQTVTCEGVLAYLLDSIQMPYEMHDVSIRQLLSYFIDNHNNQINDVSGKKKFKLGNVNVIDPNNSIYRANSEYKNTLDNINEKLIKLCGGYIRVRFEDDGRYIDYLSDYGHECTQEIKFGENILDISEHIDPDGLVTAIIPLGAVIESEEPIENAAEKRVDITSVNNGKNYLVDETAAAEYGYIFGVVNFDDVTIPANLMRKAQAYLDENKNLIQSLEITAVDLNLLNANIEKMSLGDWVRVISPQHNINKLFPITQKVMHLTKPEEGTIQLGRKQNTLTADSNKSQAEISDFVNRTANQQSIETQTAVEHSTELLSGGKGGYIVIGKDADGHPDEIYILDKPDKDLAETVVRLNKSGIGFSTTGINGEYGTAMTIDGWINGQRITADSITGDQIKANSVAANKISGLKINAGTFNGQELVLSFNNISNNIHIDGNNFQIKNGDKLVAQLSKSGLEFFNVEGNLAGTLAIRGWCKYENGRYQDLPNVEGLLFAIDPDTEYISWGQMINNGDEYYTAILTYARADSAYPNYEEGLHLGTNLYCHGKEISGGDFRGTIKHATVEDMSINAMTLNDAEITVHSYNGADDDGENADGNTDYTPLNQTIDLRMSNGQGIYLKFRNGLLCRTTIH